MNIFKFAEQGIRKLTIWDFGIVKLVLILVGMIIGAYLASFVLAYVWYFIVAAVIGYIYLIYIFFKK